MGAILGTVGSMLALFASIIVVREICIVLCPNKHTIVDSMYDWMVSLFTA